MTFNKFWTPETNAALSAARSLFKLRCPYADSLKLKAGVKLELTSMKVRAFLDLLRSTNRALLPKQTTKRPNSQFWTWKNHETQTRDLWKRLFDNSLQPWSWRRHICRDATYRHAWLDLEQDANWPPPIFFFGSDIQMPSLFLWSIPFSAIQISWKRHQVKVHCKMC